MCYHRCKNCKSTVNCCDRALLASLDGKHTIMSRLPICHEDVANGGFKIIGDRSIFDQVTEKQSPPPTKSPFGPVRIAA